MGITFTGGHDTIEKAQAELNKRKYKDKYTIATVYCMEKENGTLHFIIPIKAVDLLMEFDERNEND